MHRRRLYRFLFQLALFAVGGWLIYQGHDGWVLKRLTADPDSAGVPAQYIGYILVGFGLLGFFGVNIWYGGLLDPRRDPK